MHAYPGILAVQCRRTRLLSGVDQQFNWMHVVESFDVRTHLNDALNLQSQPRVVVHYDRLIGCSRVRWDRQLLTYTYQRISVRFLCLLLSSSVQQWVLLGGPSTGVDFLFQIPWKTPFPSLSNVFYLWTIPSQSFFLSLKCFLKNCKPLQCTITTYHQNG